MSNLKKEIEIVKTFEEVRLDCIEDKLKDLELAVRSLENNTLFILLLLIIKDVLQIIFIFIG